MSFSIDQALSLTMGQVQGAPFETKAVIRVGAVTVANKTKRHLVLDRLVKILPCMGLVRGLIGSCFLFCFWVEWSRMQAAAFSASCNQETTGEAPITILEPSPPRRAID